MTEEEYERLRGASEGQGARSVSEFARKALLSTSEPPPAVHPRCDEQFEVLETRIARVEQEVAEVKSGLLPQPQINPETT